MQDSFPTRMPTHYDLLRLEDVDSTNAEAVRLLQAREQDLKPTWILADSQNSGRGRRGRAWVSPPGNLYATLLMRPHVSASIAPQLSLVAALAVRDTIIALLGEQSAEVTLKWPNDILVNGSKLAGILLETHLANAAPQVDVGWVAIGIGVNLLHFPEDAPYPATSLQHVAGLQPDALETLHALAHNMDARLARWDKGRGFERLRADWTECAHGIGAEVSVGLSEGRGKGSEMRGIFLGLDGSGALRLRLHQGDERQIHAADVRFLRADTSALDQRREARHVQ